MSTRGITQILNDPKWLPYHGWHDDHRGRDISDPGTYLPAMQQVQGEFYEFLERYDAPRLRCLQLGLGATNAAHEVWQSIFDTVVSIDWRCCLVNEEVHPGADTHSRAAIELAVSKAPYHLIFIDAGHTYYDVQRDYEEYSPLACVGGIIAFHDSLPRVNYPEIEVHEYLKRFPNIHHIGNEVGISWLRAQLSPWLQREPASST